MVLAYALFGDLPEPDLPHWGGEGAVPTHICFVSMAFVLFQGASVIQRAWRDGVAQGPVEVSRLLGPRGAIVHTCVD